MTSSIHIILSNPHGSDVTTENAKIYAYLSDFLTHTVQM
ncbi:hypothetical protein SULYE_1592 [Sulfurihydrogenibium yellowstonense SS-5]|uniref:Uncharacterized protein n=1 Tax=Sulfurihydrogenibium yellowstonense SS-5 TaxID=432331 RepID=C4FLY8_9AQUI|nr:hypothetical protein SULYE_1592 [Sulfurihydrogenibium yellowstonense SS-5]